jgi:hypothetical protein
MGNDEALPRPQSGDTTTSKQQKDAAMIFATYALFVLALTYALVATRHLVMWRFPESAVARWMEIRDPALQALIVRHLGGGMRLDA